MGAWPSITMPLSEPSDLLASRRHSAHVGHDVVVWYRWHPYFGRTVRCEYTEERATGSVAHIVVRPGEVIVVPAWMLDREVCDVFSLGNPQVTVDALTNLHRLLIDSSLRNALLNGLNAQEVIDEGLAPTNAAAHDDNASAPANNTDNPSDDQEQNVSGM